MHPVSFTMGIFPEKIKAYEGSILTSACTVVENVDGNWYGSLLETPSFHPGIIITTGVSKKLVMRGLFRTLGIGNLLLPWKSSAEHLGLLTQYDHLSSIIALVRDYDSVGSVTIDGLGNPRVNYALSKHDQESLVFKNL